MWGIRDARARKKTQINPKKHGVRQVCAQLLIGGTFLTILLQHLQTDGAVVQPPSPALTPNVQKWLREQWVICGLCDPGDWALDFHVAENKLLISKLGCFARVHKPKMVLPRMCKLPSHFLQNQTSNLSSGLGGKLQHNIQRAYEALRKGSRAPSANGLSSPKAILSICENPKMQWRK